MTSNLQLQSRVSTRIKSTVAALELHLSRGAFTTGGQLSGVVVLRLSKPETVRALSVSISGKESPSGARLARALRRPGFFFRRDILLSGREQPRLASDRVSQFWNDFLGRDKCRMLSAGEHTYPFTISLPASLPPSYEGVAGKLDYKLAARVHFCVGKSLRVALDVPVLSTPRVQKARPVALTYPSSNGAVRSSDVNVSLELPVKHAQMGGSVSGCFTVNNPHGQFISGATVSLEVCEWVKLASGKEMKRTCVDTRELTFEDSTAKEIRGEFELAVPPDAPPTVEGTAISVIWLLKLSLPTTPPLELKTPVTIHAPQPDLS